VTDVTGVAIRKVSIWNGFPRQCVHWLGMTRRIVLNAKLKFEPVCTDVDIQTIKKPGIKILGKTWKNY